jgi:hypothetical protein
MLPAPALAQTEPSTPRPEQLVEPLGASPHVPSVAPAVLSQRPVQHSSAREHTSPICVQNEARSSHLPPVQSLEQHWLFPLQVLPAVLHSRFSALHWPLSQVPLQHCVPSEQPPPSDTQAAAWHTFP